MANITNPNKAVILEDARLLMVSNYMRLMSASWEEAQTAVDNVLLMANHGVRNNGGNCNNT